MSIKPGAKPIALDIDAKKASGTSFGADGKRYVVAGETRQIDQLRRPMKKKQYWPTAFQEMTWSWLITAMFM